uniref:Gastrin n=1 Tax=Callorhinchus milii TaxID=7868 RepID=K4FSH0_CALMI|nr:uncharacterized protein LOC103173862 precursor [Callorhinchus milii]AFK10983.1 gastrin [Callorhinchus milii]|eukprot:gi/632991374/ref/XP_007884597.1/ PREDICTED: gastrin/cholecystokinin-like peptide [Callorhinchus milii]
MSSTLGVSVLLVGLAAVCLAKPLSLPQGRGGLTLEHNGKNPSANEAAGRARSLTAEQLISRFLPQLQEGLSNKEDHYQLRDVLHQMRDRDYTGWMDFGRRSVEEYELDS